MCVCACVRVWVCVCLFSCHPSVILVSSVGCKLTSAGLSTLLPCVGKVAARCIAALFGPSAPATTEIATFAHGALGTNILIGLFCRCTRNIRTLMRFFTLQLSEQVNPEDLLELGHQMFRHTHNSSYTEVYQYATLAPALRKIS